jgi:hypothetical protein
MLAIRMSSPLFRLTTEQSIIDKVSFLNTGASKQGGNLSAQKIGLIVMKIDDTQGKAVDSKYQSLLVIFNTSDKIQTFTYNFKEDFDSTSTHGYQLHPIQKMGSDEVVKQSKVTVKGFMVPPLSSVVFVKPVSK